MKARDRRRPRPKNPSRGTRHTLSPRIPAGVELYYQRLLRAFARSFAAAMKPLVMREYSRFAKPETEERTDAAGDDAKAAARAQAADAKAVADALRKKAKVVVAEESGVVLKGSRTAGARVVAHSKKEFQRLGIDLVKEEPRFGPLIDTWRNQTVNRIVSVSEDQLDKVEKILAEGSNRRAESIAKDLERQLDDVTASQCELIARDQVLTLNALITKERQGACGIEEFIWTTSGDERVREEHEALDGETFSWEDGDAEEGFPGEPIQCRCVAYPVLPELADDDG